MYLKDIVHQNMSIGDFLDALRSDFVISTYDLPVLTLISNEYCSKTHNRYNYFVFASTFINNVANKMVRSGVPKLAGEDFRALVNIYEDFYKLKKDKSGAADISLEECVEIMPRLLSHYESLTKCYDGSSRLLSMSMMAESTMYEFAVLGALAKDNPIANHCMGSAARDVYRPLRDNLFTKYTMHF